MLGFGLFLTVLVWGSARRDAANLLQEEFKHHVSELTNRIEKRNLDSRMILRGVAGLFQASDDVTREEFSQYVQSLKIDKYYPSIRGIGLGVMVPHYHKMKFLQDVRKNGGVPEYAIRPESEREFYVPVLYRESPSGNPNVAIGFDLYADTLRRVALLEARDSGAVALTSKLNLLSQPEEKGGGIVMFAPVYRKGSKGTLEQRRANILGWAYLSFGLSELMHGVMGEGDHDISNKVAIHIYDGEDHQTKTALYHSIEKTDTSVSSGATPLIETTVVVEFANRKWTMQAHSLPELEKQSFDARQAIILGIGLFGSVMAAILVWQLITGRKRAVDLARRMSHRLVDRERRYRQMFEDNASISYIVDPETGRIIDANTVAANFWGYALDELRSMNIADINISSFESIKTDMQQQLSSGIAGQFYYSHRLQNGDVRDIEIYRSILNDQGKNYIFCIAHDITSRKQAEKDLCESQAKLHAIIETAMDAVVQLDSNGIIIDWNTRAEKIFGVLRQDVIGREMINIIIPTQHHKAYLDGMKQFLDGDDSAVRHSQFEIVAKHREGYEFPIEVATTTMIGSKGQLECCVFMHDITDRKKSENALRKARVELENRVFERTAELVRTNRRLNLEIGERSQMQDALEQSQEMLRQLVAHQDRIREIERTRIAREIHDELGQHLLVLRIDVSMLARPENEHPKLGERIDAILQHIDTTMRSVRAIINNLRPSVLDLGLHAALEWQAAEFERRSGIACELVVDDEDLLLEDSIATVLFRILQEALTNVLRHAKASRVQIELSRESKGLIMTIADNGIGIKNAKRSEQNSFGLVGIRERLHILGGELNIESNSSGTVLTITLPITP